MYLALRPGNLLTLPPIASRYPQFVLDLCLKHDAVAITVDYRLMPEASGAEIIKDVDDFYAWLRAPGNLAAHLPAGVEVDLENLLVTGESAGGYLTFHSALLASAEVKVIVLHYPMLDLRDPHYTTAYYKPLFDPPVPPIPPKVLEDHVAGLNGTEVVTNAVPMDRMPIVLSMGLEGRFGDFLGDERSLYPLEVLEDGWTSKPALPPTWILHGKQDLAVPIEGTHRFVERLQAHAATTPLHLTYEDGQHGFDEVTSSDTMWVKEGVQFIEKYWPVNAP